MSACSELDAASAQAWFDAMPRAQRLVSLSPAFAQADTRREPGLACAHVGYEEGAARWLHSVHLRGLDAIGHAAISPYGYGGPVSNCEDGDFLARAWSAYQDWARSRRVAGEFCRFHPEAGHARFFGAQVEFNRSTVSVDLAAEPLEAQYNTLARRKLRRCAGVSVRWSTEPGDWRTWGAFYRDAMQAMEAAPRYHFGDQYFAAIAAVPGVALCICEAPGGWLSAGVYLFQPARHGDTAPGGTIEYHLGASSPAGHARGSAFLLQHAAALEGRRRGLANLYLGGGTTPEPDNPLYFYKRCFSRRERPFHVGRAVHDAALLAEFARARGYDPASPPAHLLFA